MGHAPEDVMCMAVEPKNGKPLWRNTKVTFKEIHTVFQWEPCLICVLAKRRKEGMKKKNKRRKLRLSEDEEKELIQQKIDEMNSCAVGELIRCDDVGPVSPASIDGHARFFMFRDKKSREKHFFAIKNNDSETFLKCFEFVIDYYESTQGQDAKVRLLLNIPSKRPRSVPQQAQHRAPSQQPPSPSSEHRRAGDPDADWVC
jgi:hypothetical protein